MEKYVCKRFQDLKEGELVMAYGMHVFRWNFDLYGDPSYAFVPAPEEADGLDLQSSYNTHEE